MTDKPLPEWLLKLTGRCQLIVRKTDGSFKMVGVRGDVLIEFIRSHGESAPRDIDPDATYTVEYGDAP